MPRILAARSKAVFLSAILYFLTWPTKTRSAPLPSHTSSTSRPTMQAAVSASSSFRGMGAPSGVNILRGSKKAMRAVSRSTRAAVSSISSRRAFCRASISAMPSAIAAATAGFDRFSAPICRAAFWLYPARRAACVAFWSIRYSRTKRACRRRRGERLLEGFSKSCPIFCRFAVGGRTSKGARLIAALRFKGSYPALGSLQIPIELGHHRLGFSVVLDVAEADELAGRQGPHCSRLLGPEVQNDVADLEFDHAAGHDGRRHGSGWRGGHHGDEYAAAHSAQLSVIQQTSHVVVHDRELVTSGGGNRVVGDHLAFSVQALDRADDDLASARGFLFGQNFHDLVLSVAAPKFFRAGAVRQPLEAVPVS